MHRTDPSRPVPVRRDGRLVLVLVLVLAGTTAAALGAAPEAELVYGFASNQTIVTWDSAYLVRQGVGKSASGFWTFDLDTGTASLVGEVGGAATILIHGRGARVGRRACSAWRCRAPARLVAAPGEDPRRR